MLTVAHPPRTSSLFILTLRKVGNWARRTIIRHNTMTHTEQLETTIETIDRAAFRKRIKTTTDTIQCEDNGDKTASRDSKIVDAALDYKGHRGLRDRIKEGTEKLMGGIKSITTNPETDFEEVNAENPSSPSSLCPYAHNSTTGTYKPDHLFKEECLSRVNEYRRVHGVEDLKWSRDLYRTASEWARHLADINDVDYSITTDRGESISVKRGTYGKATSFPPLEAIDSFYSEVANYDFLSNKSVSGTDSTSVNDFTQMIWRDTTKFAMARAVASDGTAYIVAHYKPMGNIPGQYRKNVLPPIE